MVRCQTSYQSAAVDSKGSIPKYQADFVTFGKVKYVFFLNSPSIRAGAVLEQKAYNQPDPECLGPLLVVEGASQPLFHHE